MPRFRDSETDGIILPHNNVEDFFTAVLNVKAEIQRRHHTTNKKAQCPCCPESAGMIASLEKALDECTKRLDEELKDLDGRNAEPRGTADKILCSMKKKNMERFKNLVIREKSKLHFVKFDLMEKMQLAHLVTEENV